MALARRRFDESYVYRTFNRFYEDILRQKQKALVKAHSNMPALPDEEKRKLVDDIMLYFEVRLKEQAKEMKRLGHLNHALYLEAEYAMVALIDEVFLYLDWQGRAEWEKKILEARIFNTHNAGESIFVRIDQLLEKNDPIKIELAAIYLEMLALGFEGRYRNSKDNESIPSYIKRLYYNIFEKKPNLLAENKKLFNNPYASTLRHSSVAKLPDPKRVYQVMGGVIVLLIIISYFVWVGETYEIESRIRTIIKTLLNSSGW